MCASRAGATHRVLLWSADGSGEPKTLLEGTERQIPRSWVAAGNVMVLNTEYSDTAWDIYVLATAGDLPPEPFLAKSFQEPRASLSPDGRDGLCLRAIGPR